MDMDRSSFILSSVKTMIDSDEDGGESDDDNGSDDDDKGDATCMQLSHLPYRASPAQAEGNSHICSLFGIFSPYSLFIKIYLDHSPGEALLHAKPLPMLGQQPKKGGSIKTQKALLYVT